MSPNKLGQHSATIVKVTMEVLVTAWEVFTMVLMPLSVDIWQTLPSAVSPVTLNYLPLLFLFLSPGFDPIFFLHHANVDRLLSLWAAINPGVWVSAGVAEGDGSFTTRPGISVDQTTGMDLSDSEIHFAFIGAITVTSALTPFWNGQTTFWSSAAVGDTSKLGYTYPDFNGVDVGNTEATRTAISNLVNEFYGSSVFRTFSSFGDTTKKVSGASPCHNPTAPQQHSLLTLVTDLYWGRWSRNWTRWMMWPQLHKKISATPDRGQIWDWTARVEFKKYELGTGFSVLIKSLKILGNGVSVPTTSEVVMYLLIVPLVNVLTAVTNEISLWKDLYTLTIMAIVQRSGLGNLPIPVGISRLQDRLNAIS